MEIVQKRFSNKATFSFGDKELRYTIKDSSGSQAFSIEYGAIPTDVNELEERNVWYRNVGIFWVALGLLQIGMRFADQGELRGSLWLTLGVLCFVVYWSAKTKYTTINTDKGRIFVIANKQHDQVMSEIETRRKAQWHSWYAEVNFGNEPRKEIGKFQWLRERGVITDAECKEAIERITQHHDLQPEGPAPEAIGRRLN
jgi:hypothetical protein